ncbi:retrovirus-related pol polyprotein from transposon TNT 1-94 [Tanacetum coccineum]|uniref:Retrovirus-related pol polyprotein from transposon TNT 1-94 n=1 Tax=Tanacetum coccineum TaxID=301880 RepID=A0ABQ5HDT7_9ASTR
MVKRFNTIISLKALDESFSSCNHVRKFLRALPTKWRPKVTAIEESKDLFTLPLDELIGNLKVYEVVLKKDLEISKNKKENYKSLALKARKVLSEEEATSSDSDDEKYTMANFRKVIEGKKEKDGRRCFKCGDPNHFISDYPKHSFNDQKAFVVGRGSDSGDNSKKEEICLMALDNNEVLSDTPYYSSLSLHDGSWENEYGNLCKISLRIINKNKQLKAKNEVLKREACELKAKVEQLERNKEISLILETAAQAIHDAVTTHQVMASQHFMTVSARTDSNADLEDSTYDGITTKTRCRRVETMKVEESLNVKIDESPPLMSPPLEDDDILECKVIDNKEKDLEIKENEPLNKEIINIKESKDHPLETVIDENGVVSRNKARLVAQGYNQQERIDFDETYAPVARLESTRILLAYACAHDFKLNQMDVKSAFLNGFINEEVNVAQPPGFINFAKT